MIPRRLVDRERRLRDVRDPLGVGELERVDVLLGLDEHDLVGRLAHRALDLLVAVVADEHDRVAGGGEAAGLDVHLRHERAGRVDRLQAPRPGVLVHARRHAVRGEDGDRPLGDLGLGVDEDRAAAAQLLDDVLVVHDLLAHVDRRPVALERPLDGLDGAVDAGAVAARRRQEELLDGVRHRGHRPILRTPRHRRTRVPRRRSLTGRRRRRPGGPSCARGIVTFSGKVRRPPALGGGHRVAPGRQPQPEQTPRLRERLASRRSARCARCAR